MKDVVTPERQFALPVLRRRSTDDDELAGIAHAMRAGLLDGRTAELDWSKRTRDVHMSMEIDRPIRRRIGITANAFLIERPDPTTTRTFGLWPEAAVDVVEAAFAGIGSIDPDAVVVTLLMIDIVEMLAAAPVMEGMTRVTGRTVEEEILHDVWTMVEANEAYGPGSSVYGNRIAATPLGTGGLDVTMTVEGEPGDYEPMLDASSRYAAPGCIGIETSSFMNDEGVERLITTIAADSTFFIVERMDPITRMRIENERSRPRDPS